MKNALARTVRILLACCGWAAVVSILWVALLRFIPPPVTWLMVEQAGVQGAVQREWTPMDRLAPALPLAVIAAEDQGFFDHAGFEVEAIRKALRRNKQGGRTRGASTISQQTAKNVFLWPARTFLRKGLEAWFTLLIEGLWGKERILEVYLNVAETGPGRFGAEATAQACFKRSAQRLSPAQSALIAAVLPAPRRYQACAPSAYVQRRQAWVQRQVRQLGNLMDPAERARIKASREGRKQPGKR